MNVKGKYVKGQLEIAIELFGDVTVIDEEEDEQLNLDIDELPKVEPIKKRRRKVK